MCTLLSLPLASDSINPSNEAFINFNVHFQKLPRKDIDPTDAELNPITSKERNAIHRKENHLHTQDRYQSGIETWTDEWKQNT